MSEIEKQVSRYYNVGGVMPAIQKALNIADKINATRVAVDDLAFIDAFHTRGRQSTMELAALVNPRPAYDVLDVGSGLGGSARFLTEKFGCTVSGIDLTRYYTEIARQLTELTGLSERVKFFHGTALEMPFADDTFDIVWTEHAQMNIAEKDRFYREIVRVLKPGRWFAFHDVFAGKGTPVFPLPWADSKSISSLVTADEARTSMKRAGLTIQTWVDKLHVSLEFFEQMLEKIRQDEMPPAGVHLLMGENAEQKIANYVRNLRTGATTVAMGVAEKTV